MSVEVKESTWVHMKVRTSPVETCTIDMHIKTWSYHIITSSTHKQAPQTPSPLTCKSFLLLPQQPVHLPHLRKSILMFLNSIGSLETFDGFVILFEIQIAHPLVVPYLSVLGVHLFSFLENIKCCANKGTNNSINGCTNKRKDKSKGN